jgi:hypothetical protein
MRRDQLEHAIRTACQIIDRPEVIVVGSQPILGTYREDQLPAAATMSVEVDILPGCGGQDETARLADLIEGVAGSGPATSVMSWQRGPTLTPPRYPRGSPRLSAFPAPAQEPNRVPPLTRTRQQDRTGTSKVRAS